MPFNFLNYYTLENEFVKLRPLEASDFEHLRQFSIQEPDLWTYSLVQANSEQNLRDYMSIALKAKENQTAYPFIVYDKTKDEYAGSTRFYDIQLANSSVQLGYTWYGKKFQRTGLNRHCKYLMLEFAFDTLGMHRVEFRADYDNKRSIEAMKKIGCTQEGVLRSHGFRPDGTRRDSIILSILRKEWEDHLKEELKLKCSAIK